jgi:3'-5' exoribonuclease
MTLHVKEAKELIERMEEWLDTTNFTSLALYALNLPGFLELPGSVSGKHHAHPGGLLRHTLEVLQLSRSMAASPAYNRRAPDPIVLAIAAVWCDAGKALEYELLAGGGARLSQAGASGLSHIMLGLVEWGKLRRDLADIWPLTEKQEQKILHCIGGHHSKLEWGSPVVPNTAEAIILAHADIQSIMLDGNKNPELRREAL